jgi:hypothetical protein
MHVSFSPPYSAQLSSDRVKLSTEVQISANGTRQMLPRRPAHLVGNGGDAKFTHHENEFASALAHL